MPIQWNTRTAEQRGWTDWYHVSPRRNRESILQHGLQGADYDSPWENSRNRGQWGLDQPPGNYFFDDPQSAEDYAWDNQMGGGYDGVHRDPDLEDLWEWPEPPDEYYGWPYERQEAWHDENEPVERTEDPNGWDVWRVDTRGLPIHRDPESALTNPMRRLSPKALSEQLRQPPDYSSPDYDPWQLQLGQNAGDWGQTPRRFYTPQAVDPSRMQLHRHLPAWDMNENAYLNRQEDPTVMNNQTLQSWDALQLHRPLFPAHSSVKTADDATTFNPVAPIDELANYLGQQGGSAAGMINPNNPLSQDADPQANAANPNMNPSMPGAFNNPSNPELNPNLPGAVTNPSNPEYNPNMPGAQNNPSNYAWNPQFPTSENNPASPQLNPIYPDSWTNPSNPIHNPDYPDPQALMQRPQGVSPDASFPPGLVSTGNWEWSRIASPAPEPPNFRKGNNKHHCGNCKMFDRKRGQCWGYGNKNVDTHDLCDSWSPETKTSRKWTPWVPLERVAEVDFNMGDSKEWADPTAPRSTFPPAPMDCTCAEGHKLDCPVHGMHPIDPDFEDVSWHIPQTSPTGFPQGEASLPRGWQTPYTS